MRTSWFRVDASIVDNPKWTALSWAERGKWLAVRALAERQPTTSFRSREQLLILLRKEGDTSPARTVDRLLELRLLDETDDARIEIHDLGDYLRPTSTDRVQEHRDRVKRGGNAPKRSATSETPTDVTDVTDNTDVTLSRARASAGSAPRPLAELVGSFDDVIKGRTAS